MARVVSASLGASGPLLLKLADLLANECIRLKGVRREIRYLRSELASMDAALEGYTLIQDPNVQVKTWISLVRELAYDTEDCFDKFIHHLGNGGHHGSFKEFFRKAARQFKTLGSRRDIADQIDELKARVKLVKELKSSYKLDDIACSTVDHAAMNPRLSALFAEEAHLVGVDGPRDELAEWIMEEQDGYTSRRVLSIVGLGGLGKTTLANEVYRKIQGQFDCRALVSISQKPEVNKIVKDVISQVSCEGQSTKDIDSWDEKKSIAKLRALLQDKRYLIVIDDIWSISAWNDIKCAFPENTCSSKIIATTRIIDVARSCCLGCDDRIYDMQPLSDLYSKRLFLKRIFGSEDCCPDVLKGISNEILKKCGGLPLAIISISSLLANIPTVKDEWDRVKRSIGSALDKDKNLEAVNSILSLSYNNLSPNLKTCLLYLSNFPEDCVIERERLVRRWMAEGFIPDERGQSQQEVAESYFYKLINNSMIQPVDIGYDGKARACRIHDMMLELIILKSAEENFITVVNGGQTVWENPDCHIRRLSIQDIDHELASVLARKNLRHVRSLTITGPVCTTHLPSLSKFESLRVLDFDGCRSLEGYDMKNVDKLFQLKYLSFRGTKILKMPLGIVMLHDLETLDICETHIQGLPAGIVQLTKLQHLLVRTWGEAGGRTKIPEGIRNMSSLRVAQGFDIAMSSVGAIEELGYLTSLNQLDIELNGEGSDEYRRHEEMLLSSLCKLGNYKLHELRICSLNSTPLEFLDSWFPLPSFLRIFQMLSYYYLLKAPKCIAPELTNLAYLTINLVEVTQEDLCLLGKLHALLRLELWLKSHQKERLTVQGFPIIKEFIIGSLQWGGVCVTFVKGGMPNLEKLHMTLHVSMVTTWAFYFGIEHLRYIKEATVYFYPMGAEYSETKAAAAVIRSEASAHPNYPKVSILKLENGGLINAED